MQTAFARSILALGFGFLLVAGAQAEEPKWFDMEKCAFCKNIAQKPEVMENLEWETVKTSTGIAAIETVPPEHVTAYRLVNKAMQNTGKRFLNGEKLYLCGFCLTMGSLIREGVHHEWVPISDGSLSLLSSDDPELQKRIWAFHEKAEVKKKELMAGKEHGHAQK